MRYYLTSYLGNGRDDNGYVPPGSDQPGWRAVDLRPDSTKPDGRCLLALPVHDPTVVGLDLGEDLDASSSLLRTRLGNALGVSLGAARLRHMLGELLFAHGREDGSRWRPLQAAMGRYELWLGELVWSSPVLAGGAEVAEHFNTANSDTLGPRLTWTEVSGDIDIVSNRASCQTPNGNDAARAEHNLATADHYAQCVLATLIAPDSGAGFQNGGPCARFDPTSSSSGTRTYYQMQGRRSTSEQQRRLIKRVSGTLTTLGGPDTMTVAGTTLRVSPDGSTIKGYVSGTEHYSVTDTSITGHLRTGICGEIVGAGNGGAAGDVEFDDFLAADLWVRLGPKLTLQAVRRAAYH